jgi:four helix bundle protein
MKEKVTKKLRVFFNYTKGSAGELRTQIFSGMEIKYIDSQVGQTWILEVTKISKMLLGVIKSVLIRD